MYPNTDSLLLEKRKQVTLTYFDNLATFLLLTSYIFLKYFKNIFDKYSILLEFKSHYYT